mgnify:CR=1 FL=1
MIVKFVNKLILIIAALLCLSLNSYAQYSSKEELKEAANKMFEEKDYGGSLKLFSQLLSTYPKDPNYNYKYGACVLFGSRVKDEALHYLKFAVTNSNVDPVAFYFLGKGYHHEYEFSKALKNYKLFKEKATSKDQKKYSVDREIEMCQNGGSLLKSMVDIGVLSKKEIKESDFFRSYKLNGIGGTIIVKPEQFKTKLDKKNNEKSIVYLGQAKDMVLFSSYGKNGANGKDIYKSVKNSNGDWGEATLFSANINSQFDEDYPFLHPDGKTLYFSSKGYTSMGGYDVFKSTFNAITKEWSTPQNLDFPINTPDDDILYISDMENKLAYFASSRASKQGEFTVYNVAVKSVPFIHSVINGFFLAESNPEMKNATITVRAIDKDRRYGVHKTKSKTGEYLLMFPTNGGKFKILVETTEGAPVHSAIIEIPELKDFRYLKQELRLVGEGDDEKLIVKNLFDESDDFDMNNPLVVQNILKERAKMEVNITEEELNSSVKFSEEESFAGNNLSNSLGTALTNTLNKSAYKELSDKELIDKTNETVSKIISQIEISRVKSISSYKIAEDKSYEAKLLFAESEQLIIDAELVGSEKEKQEKTVLAESKKMEAAMFVNEVVVALSIAKTLDNEMIERASDLERVKSLQRVINAKIDIKERGLAELELKKLDEIATASYHNESALDIESKIINDNFLTEEKKYNKLNENVVDLNDRENELTASIKKLNEKKEQTKKKKEVEGIDAQIKSLEFDIEDTQYDLEKARKKIPFAKVSYLQSKSEAAITQSVIAMLNGEDNDDIEITDSQKIKIENDLAYFKKNGLVGLLEQEEFASLYAFQSASLQGAEAVVSEKVEPVAVVDSKELEFEEVAIVSESEEGVAEAMAVEETEFTEEPTTYKGKHTAELDSFSGKDTYESTTLKAAIYADRAKDIEEEITLKKADLSIVNDAEKKEIEKDIAILEYSLLEQEEFASLYAIESKSLQGTEVITTEKVERVDIVNSERLEPEEIAEVTDVDGAELIAESTTYKGQHEAELSNFSGKDTYESTTLKAEIHADWVKDIEEEIILKKTDLSIANAAEKKEIEKDIAILEYSLLEQEEFASLYAFQSASLQGADLITAEKVEPVVTNVNNGNINKELNSEPGAKESAVDFIEELTLADKEVISELEPTTITTVKKEASYIEYAALKKQKRRLVKEAKVEYVKSKQVENEIGRQKQLIGSLNSIDETTETEVQKTDRVLEIEKIEKAISGNEIKLIALRKRVKEMQDSAQNLNKQADAILANTNEATAKNYAVIEKAETFDSNLIAKVMRKSIDSSEIKEPIVNTTRASIVSIDNIPTVLKESIFVMNKNTAVYNESKRIPVSPKLPEGLVFKVQIGAFRNPIPQSHFRGFAPIMAENAGKGITRYTAGLFKTFNMANEAKGSIRSIGYSDAFVVAFFNGKRINMTQAREMLNGGAANEESIANNKKANNIQNTSASITPKILVVTKEVKDGISKDVRNIEGVFFTIQVGVYSKEVTIGQLNNLSPLNSERTASGLIRYTSGMFTRLEEANAVKERIRADGITDAFVVAYSNGVKTNIAAAKTKLELNAISPSNKVPAENLTIKFKVQLGEYTSDVSVDEADLFLKLTSRGIKNYIQDDKTIYIIGSFNSYSSATDLQIKMKEMGVRNPKVVAFEKSKAIDLNEALKRIENK